MDLLICICILHLYGLKESKNIDWLGFGLAGIQKYKKLLPTLLCVFVAALWIYSLLSNINFSFFVISYQEEFQSVKYYLFRISTSRNKELKKLLKLSFLVFSTDFFEFCRQYLWHFEYVPITSPRQFLIVHSI